MLAESISRAAKGNDVKNTVLIVDDNPTLLYFTARNLQRDLEGVEVVTATSCETARAAAAERPPSVVVADLKLGDGNGLELLEELARSHPGMAGIIVSGEEIPRSNTTILFGALTKPYEAEALVTLVTNALQIDAERPVPAEKPLPVPCEGYDRHDLQNSLAGLLAGLRAFGADLSERASDPAAVTRTVDEYLDRLCSVVVEISRKLPACPADRKGNGGSNTPRNRMKL
jgi:two-component system response regulator RegA